MPSTIAFDNVEITNAHRLRVRLGESFIVKLPGMGTALQWFADNDEVLSIDDDGGAIAKVRAASVGRTEIQVQRDRRIVAIFYVEVFAPRAGYFAVSVGQAEQK